MRKIPMRLMLFEVAALSLAAGALLLTNAASVHAAQDNAPCPFTNDSVVSPALGSPVQGYADPGTPPGFDVCEFGDFTIYRQSVTDAASNLALAQNVVLGLPAEVAAQVGGLGAGRTLDLPGYQIATLDGLADAALWVRNSSFGVDALVVQPGNEVFVFQVLDRMRRRRVPLSLARWSPMRRPRRWVARQAATGRPSSRTVVLMRLTPWLIVCSAPTSAPSTSSADVTMWLSERPWTATEFRMPPRRVRSAIARPKWLTPAASWASP
jgi:hypothetical protein